MVLFLQGCETHVVYRHEDTRARGCTPRGGEGGVINLHGEAAVVVVVMVLINDHHVTACHQDYCERERASE